MPDPVYNDHNVYILGAGFSWCAGMPLVRDFLNRTRDARPWLDGITGRQDEVTAIDKVLAFRKAASSSAYRIRVNIEDIEQLFSLASADASAGVAGSMVDAITATLDYAKTVSNPVPATFFLPNGVPGFTAWTNQTANHTHPNHVGYVVNPYDVYAGILSGAFCEQRHDARSTVLTFNYDLELEDGLARINQPFNYGMKNVSIDASATATRDLGLPILKLHGSVNWAYQGQQGKKLTIYRDYAAARAAKSRLIVPPTWQKTFDRGLRQVWAGAVKAISEATRIVVIGFSIPETDIHFKYLLAAGLKENISLRQVIFVNPDKTIERRVADLFQPDRVEARDAKCDPSKTREFLLNTGAIGDIGRPLKGDYLLG